MKTVRVILSFLACFIAAICYAAGLSLGFVTGSRYGPYAAPLLAAVMVLLARKLWNKKQSIRDIGLAWKGHRWDALRGICLGILLILAGFLSIRATGDIEVVSISFVPEETALLALEFLLTAFAEEICFREVMLSTLMGTMNRYLALFSSALFFSAMHFLNPSYSWASFLGIFLAGLLLGAAFIFTRNLWFPVGLHFSWNLVQSLVGFPVSGGTFGSMLELFYPKGYSLWNGGEFGFEASLPCFILVSVTLFLLLRHYLKSESTLSEYEKTDFPYLG